MIGYQDKGDRAWTPVKATLQHALLTWRTSAFRRVAHPHFHFENVQSSFIVGLTMRINHIALMDYVLKWNFWSVWYLSGTDDKEGSFKLCQVMVHVCSQYNCKFLCWHFLINMWHCPFHLVSVSVSFLCKVMYYSTYAYGFRLMLPSMQFKDFLLQRLLGGWAVHAWLDTA